MNPLITQKARQIIRAIEALKDELAEARKQLDAATEARRQLDAVTEARDELQKRVWAQGKEIAVYKDRVEELADLRRENKRLTDQIRGLEERLLRVLERAEALEAEFKS